MLYDLLKELVFENKEKVIIFTQYKESLDLLKKNLEDEFDLSFIYGEIDSKERFEIVKDFKSNPKRQVLIMTDAGAEGLNLQEANNLIHYNDNYSPAKMIQRNGRVDRIGQKRVVRIYRFICKDTIEERVRELLEKKQTVNNSILDEDNKELSVSQTSTMDILGCL
jgi:SNF2 family DNA or RNA helicase